MSRHHPYDHHPDDAQTELSEETRMGYIVRVRPAKGAKVKKDDPSDYNSVAMRPKSFAHEINLLSTFIVLAFVALLSSTAVIICSFKYKAKYDKDDTGTISDEQTKLYKLADMCWTAVAFTMVPIAGSGIFEYISLVGIQAGYVEVINQYRHAAQKGTPGRKLEEAQLADEQLTERAVRKWLKKRFIFYLLLTIAIIGVSAYLARAIWVKGTHPPIKKWQWRMVKVVRGKGKNARVFKLELLNYFIIAEIVIYAIWALEMLLVIYYLNKAEDWPELNTILAVNVPYHKIW